MCACMHAWMCACLHEKGRESALMCKNKKSLTCYSLKLYYLITLVTIMFYIYLYYKNCYCSFCIATMSEFTTYLLWFIYLYIYSYFFYLFLNRCNLHSFNYYSPCWQSLSITCYSQLTSELLYHTISVSTSVFSNWQYCVLYQNLKYLATPFVRRGRCSGNIVGSNGTDLLLLLLYTYFLKSGDKVQPQLLLRPQRDYEASFDYHNLKLRIGIHSMPVRSWPAVLSQDSNISCHRFSLIRQHQTI